MTSPTSDLAPVRPVAFAEINGWDAEADVVVVGAGCAGMSAAIGAASEGSEVLVLERSGDGGGAAAMAGGEIYLGGGTPVQQACGFQDTPDAMYAYLLAATGPGADEVKLARYCEESVEHFHWLVGCGVEFKASFYARPCWEPPTDDGLVYSGGENAHPFNQLVAPAPRAHIPQMQSKRPGSKSSGWVLMQRLAETAAGAGAKRLTDTRAEALVTGPGGEVVGVVARHFAETRTVRARRGVVLAGGGFAANAAMVSHYAPLLVGHAPLGTDGDDGLSIRLGQGAGGLTKHMDAAQTAIPTVPALLYPSLLVNEAGQRFINEDTYAGRVGQAAVFHQHSRTYLVLDEEIFESVPEEERWGGRPTWAAETVAELEADMGLPARSLQATVEVYNHHASSGVDPLFHKRAEWLKPLAAPFGAINLCGLPYAVFTLGGLVTTPDGEVRGPGDEVIPGLYAAGRSTSGIPAWGYTSGTSLGDSTFFGRRAGRAAARRDAFVAGRAG